MSAGWVWRREIKVWPRSGSWLSCGGRAGIAQLVEQLICNQQVIGSSPIAGSLLNHSWVGKSARFQVCTEAVRTCLHVTQFAQM
jgi:hypothetical protein